MTGTIEYQDAEVKHHRLLRRQASDRISAMAEYLPPADRMLVRQVYEYGLPVSEVAQVRGVPARILQRRLAKLLCRMRQPVFRLVAQREELLPRHVRVTARHIVLGGESLRRASQSTGQSLHHVREHMRVVQALARL